MVAPPSGPLYLDSSALVKLYLPEPGSAELNAALGGRRDVLASELSVTEMVSALSRRRREGRVAAGIPARVQRESLRHLQLGQLGRVELLAETHREAERLLLESLTRLRGMDALHLALALGARARTLVSFDRRQREAARTLALALFPADF